MVSSNIFDINHFSKIDIKLATKYLINTINIINQHYGKPRKIIKINGDTNIVKLLVIFGMATPNQSLAQFCNVIGKQLFMRLLASLHTMQNFNYSYFPQILKFMFEYRTSIHDAIKNLNHPYIAKQLDLNNGFAEGMINNNIVPISTSSVNSIDSIYTYLFNHPEVNLYNTNISKRHIDVEWGTLNSNTDKQYLNDVHKNQPKCVIFHIEYGYTHMQYAYDISQILEQMNYDVDYYLFDDSKFGVTNNTYHLIMIGINKHCVVTANAHQIIKTILDKQSNSINTPSAVLSKFNFKSIPLVSMHNGYIITNLCHTLPVNQQTINYLEQGATFMSKDSHNRMQFYYKLLWNSLGDGQQVHGANLIHPIYNRLMSIRELAKLQTFPDSFVFFGSYKNCNDIVMSSIPPRLSKLIGHLLINNVLLQNRD